MTTVFLVVWIDVNFGQQSLRAPERLPGIAQLHALQGRQLKQTATVKLAAA